VREGKARKTERDNDKKGKKEEEKGIKDKGKM
jgi:hypothetical protein